MILVYYSQEDPRWAKLLYSNHRDPKQSFGTSACGPTCAAMAFSTLLGRAILPPEMAKYAIDHGFRTDDNGTDWGLFERAAKDYGLMCKRTGSLDEVKLALADGANGIAAMGPGHTTGGGHYIHLVGIKGKWIDVFDPNHDNAKYGNDGLIDQGIKNDGKVRINESVLQKEARQYWIITSPIKEEDLPMTKEEKLAFDKLNGKVDELTSLIATLKLQIDAVNEQTAAPKWFVAEFGSADLGGKISNPKFTEEGWRTLAVSLRLQGLGKGKN
jgi:hypothetical protein